MLAEAVVAATRGEVVDRKLKPVAAQKPLEGVHGTTGVSLSAGGRVRLDLRLNQGGRVQRLFVTVTGRRLSTAAAVMTDQAHIRTVAAQLARIPVQGAHPGA